MRLSLVQLVALAVVATAVVLALHAWSRPRGPAPGAVRASWQLTPGVVNPEVTQATIGATICKRGWTRTVRPPVSYTNELKVRGLVQYGLRGPLSGFQEDHLISLELGGNPTDPRNLWPEPYPRAAAVDRIENELNARVCSRLADARRGAAPRVGAEALSRLAGQLVGDVAQAAAGAVGVRAVGKRCDRRGERCRGTRLALCNELAARHGQVDP